MYNLVPVTCKECDKSFFKTNAMQEHMIRAHGIYTRVCLQCSDNDRIIAGYPIDLYKPMRLQEDQRAKACESMRNQPPNIVCNLCQKDCKGYTQMKSHLDKCHHIKSQVCLARAYNDEIVCRTKQCESPTTVLPDAIVPEADAAADAVADAITSNTVQQVQQAQPHQGVARAYFGANANQRVASVSHFGTTKIIKFFHPPEEPDTFSMEALQDEAYACGDLGDTRWDEAYERFEAQEQVLPSHSLYKNVQGETVITSFEGGMRYIEFKYNHINSDDMIDAIVRGTLPAVSCFMRLLFDNSYNLFLYKRSSSFPFTDVHMKYGCWTIQQDSHVYPRIVESIASAMRKYMNDLVRIPRFTRIFNGTRDYESLDHFLYVLGIVHGTSDLDPDYAREMLQYFYKYVKELREIVANYSKTNEMPWVAYPASGPV